MTFQRMFSVKWSGRKESLVLLTPLLPEPQSEKDLMGGEKPRQFLACGMLPWRDQVFIFPYSHE